MVPPLITLEEHYVSSTIRHQQGKNDKYAGFPPQLMNKLADLSATRISDMDAGQVSVQVLSHSPLDASPELCKTTNDELAKAVSTYPDRLKAFAILPMGTPEAAAAELARCVHDLHFVGALINNHLNGTFYDAESFWPVFAAAVELDVPIYIHPTFASDTDAQKYSGNFSSKAAFSMSIAGWGWHSETALHILRLWASGLFHRYPKLKIVIGHMGEMLPFQIERIAPQTAGWETGNQRSLMEVWKENIWVTTSGMFTMAPMECLLKLKGTDKVMYSVDYPFSANEKGLAFVEMLEGSGVVDKDALDAICYGNAEKLFGIKVKA